MRLTRVTNVSKTDAPLAGAYIRVLHASAEAEEIDVPPVGVVVGADPGSDVVLVDDAVSGRHAAIVPVESGFEVRDLQSRNGTYVDGVTIDKAVVPPGGILRVGRTLIQLMPGEEASAIPPSEADRFGSMLGTSVVMRQVFGLLERASSSSASVLLLGESGTGKELAARAVHDSSDRKNGPFVVFDCGAAAENLVESALFGHVKGAFTGAASDRKGAFAAANGGTLFLDEIGDLPLPLQPKLLRMLESGEVNPIGADGYESFHVRIVAATHRDLLADVSSGLFRGDLYYRLAVVEIHLPALRQRRDDIPQLVDRFLEASGSEARTNPCQGLDKLLAYHWPGNVRELRNVVSRAVALASPQASFEELPILLRQRTQSGAADVHRADRPFHDAKADLVARFEREYLSDLLRKHGDNLSKAARVAGLERKYLYKLLERAGLR